MSQASSITQTPASQLNTRKYNILIDTDIGDDIDDALALSLALCSPEIALLGVTTVFGDTQKRAHLATHILEVFRHEDIPVAAGQQMHSCSDIDLLVYPKQPYSIHALR